MLLTRRLERARPGRSASSQRICVGVWGSGTSVSWSGRENSISRCSIRTCSRRLEAWLAESALMKRTFRTCAVISA